MACSPPAAGGKKANPFASTLFHLVTAGAFSADELVENEAISSALPNHDLQFTKDAEVGWFRPCTEQQQQQHRCMPSPPASPPRFGQASELGWPPGTLPPHGVV